MKRTLSLLVFALVSTSSIVSLYAADAKENDALAVMATKVSLSQAVTTAEQHVNGKAARAELEKLHQLSLTPPKGVLVSATIVSPQLLLWN